MPITRIKICGLTTVDSALAAAAAGADAIGLVFVQKSPRCVEVATAKAIVERLPAFVDPVGLFVDEPPDRVRQVAAAVGLRTVQLHGQEPPEDVAALAGLRVVKAMGFEPGAIRDRLRPWYPVAEKLAGVLLDAPPDASPEGLTGGSGHAFDWGRLEAAQRDGVLDGLPPMILAGGLNPKNVAEAIRRVRPYAVDVSSGVESSRGVKDPGQIVSFCAAVRRAEAGG